MHKITTGILIGLGWGLAGALLEGLPLLLEGAPWPHLAPRLLALAYLASIYGALGAVAGGLLGVLAMVILPVTRRTLSRAMLAATLAGLFAAVTTAVFWLHRFDPRLAGWLVVLGLAVPIGLAVRWLFYRAGCSHRLRWSTCRAAVLLIYGVALVTVIAAAGFRLWYRERPILESPGTSEAGTAQQPNIVLITAAGLRPDHLGAYSHDSAVTPNIDALAQGGVRFEHVVSQAAWTEPSLASLLTSLYPSQLNIACQAGISCQPHLDEERTTIAEVLQDLGYRTQAFVTSHWLTAELGFGQGYDGFESVRKGEPFDVLPMRSRTLGRLLGCRSGSSACRLLVEGYGLLYDAPIPPDGGGRDLNGRVQRYLDQYGGKRFFLWVHYNETLPPYDTEPPLLPLPIEPTASGERRLRRMGYWQLGDPFTAREDLLPSDGERLAMLYDGEIHGLDNLVGDLLRALDSGGLRETTLVVLTSDHGQEFSEHGGYTFGHSLYDEVLRVPLILDGPGVESGQVVGMPVALLDLAPTLVEYTGGSPLSEAEGRSLAPLLRGEVLGLEPIYSESLYRVPKDLKSMRLGDYKLIYNLDAGTHELYDLGIDPLELQDLSSEASEVADKMESQLLDWMAYTDRTADALPRAAAPAEYTPPEW